MNYSDVDVIVAPATSSGVRAPLAIVRVSGKGSWNYVAEYFKGELKPWRVSYGDWCDDQGVLDDVMVTAFRAPSSYTGQDMVEISCHGNPLIVDRIVKLIVAAGARRAKPGEFTMRAVLNGKMDLLRAESVNGIIEANTRYQVDLVRRQVTGPLVGFVQQQVEEILQIQAHIEASIDYGEEDIDALDREGLIQRLDAMLVVFERLRATGRFASGMKRGFRVLITGEPNVGKSTLFNWFVKHERAIVTPLPGTTRDLIHEDVEIGGLPIVLIDSAGVRETDDLVEHMGIEKIFQLLDEVDLILYLSAADDEKPPYDKVKELPAWRWVHVTTKIDLVSSVDDGKIAVSVASGAGLKRLEREVVVRLSSVMEGQQIYLVNQRQEEVIGEVIQQLGKAREEYAAGFGEEVLSAYLNTARRSLGELTGDTTVEDILDRMFSNFCLGK